MEMSKWCKSGLHVMVRFDCIDLRKQQKIMMQINIKMCYVCISCIVTSTKNWGKILLVLKTVTDSAKDCPTLKNDDWVTSRHTFCCFTSILFNNANENIDRYSYQNYIYLSLQPQADDRYKSSVKIKESVLWESIGYVKFATEYYIFHYL